MRRRGGRGWQGTTPTRSGSGWCSPRKGTEKPTSLTYDQALEEALCHGWIDGQAGRREDATYRQRFTPRRRRSAWSKRNTGIAERLIAEDRMRPAGHAEVRERRLTAAGRPPTPAQRAWRFRPTSPRRLPPSRRRRRCSKGLNSQNRYAVLYRIATAKRADTRARKIEQFVAMLSRGETVHPQKRRRSE
jgi:uncharacterized protein YdeI (YjbR/CyaY-like superfamily)